MKMVATLKVHNQNVCIIALLLQDVGYFAHTAFQTPEPERLWRLAIQLSNSTILCM